MAGFIEIIQLDDFKGASKSVSGAETGTQDILLRLFIVRGKFS
jgi:hypothetical protein